MARGKFNKRGGGKRVDAQSADEIEQRNQRLAEFEENRAKRRAEEEEAQNGGGDDEEEEEEDDGKKKKGDDSKDKAPVVVTSEEDHKKNLAKLAMVRKRREQAEARRKAQEEEELAQEMERKAQLKKMQDDDSDGDDDGKKKKKKSKAKDIPKLSKIEIKKMKPAQMKEGKCFEVVECKKRAWSAFCFYTNYNFSSPTNFASTFICLSALKERGLDIQGNKNTLLARLVEYEASR